MRQMKWEARISGANLFWISALVAGLLSLMCAFGGDLAALSFVSYEVLYPFYAAIAVTEWGKIRTDPIFDIAAAQSRSLFLWIVVRFACVFLAVSGIAAIGIWGAQVLREEAGYGELLWVYGSTALFFASFGTLVSLLSRVEHLSAALTGMVWLFFLAARAIVETSPATRYFYPFMRLVAPADSIWILNKWVLLALSGLFWAGIWRVCRTRRLIQD